MDQITYTGFIWARAIRKILKLPEMAWILLWHGWNWKVVKNIWCTEHDLLGKTLDFPNRLEIRILRRNDKKWKIDNSKAQYFMFVDFGFSTFER